MAAKPDIDDTRWAETAGGTPNSGEIVEPASGKKDVGWVNGEKPPSEYFNQWQNGIYQWMKYLNDGALDGDHTIDGALGVDGTFTMGAFRIAATVPMVIPACAFATSDSNGIFDTDGRRTVTASASTVFFAPIVLPQGARITSIDWVVTRGGSGTITGQLRLLNDTGSDSTIDTVTINTGSATATHSSAALTANVSATDSYNLKLTLDNNSQTLEMVRVNWTKPA